MTEASKKPFGRPTLYSEELAAHICYRVATNTCGLKKLSKLFPELPDETTINDWRFKYDDFSMQYVKAKQLQSELLAEEVLEISDNDSEDIRLDKDGNPHLNTEFVARSRLRIDTRKWLASKLAPKIYGEKAQQAEQSNPQETLSKIAAMVADLNKVNESEI